MLSQIVRYGIVGLASNSALYLAYLVLTNLGVGNKLAMTVLFLIGVLQTFLLNKTWSFAYRGLSKASFFKYIFIYSIAYLLNWGALWVLVEHWAWHQLVQGVVICVIAIMLFVSQRYWVFCSKKISN